MDYLEAITQRSTSIPLNGQELEVRRANLGLHYRLSVTLDQWQEARRNLNYGLSVDLTFSYIALATGLDTEEVKQAKPSEILIGFVVLTALNRPSGDLPFMREKRDKVDYDYDYDNRGLAYWVSRLSACYSWTAEHILEGLTPEEAACYMQEVLIKDHEDKEFLYKLSDASVKIVGKGKSARTVPVPFPRPSWMVKKPPKVRMPKSWLPQGVVIEAGDIGRATANA